MSHPRDPRLRRQQPDALGAAVRLDLAADAMRATTRERGPEVLAAAMLGTHEPRLTADEFLAALGDPGEVAESPEPSGSLPPAPAAPTSILVRDDDTGEIARWTDGVRAVVEPAHLTHTIAEDVPAEVAQAFSSERSAPRPGWRSRHDPRSLAYGIRPRLAGAAPWQDVLLPTGPVLDQMTAGATLEEQSCCTGCGTVAAVNTMNPRHADPSAPVFGGPLDLEDAETVYRRAQQLDAVPGEDYPGTSINAAMQAAVELGLFGGYLWAFGTRDIAQTLLHRRLPVVIGIPWLSGMWETGPGGLVVVQGDDEGLGHCLTVNGLKLKGPQGQPGPYFRWQQSAGVSYGDGGFGWIHHRDLAQLLAGIGEAAVPTLEAQHPR